MKWNFIKPGIPLNPDVSRYLYDFDVYIPTCVIFVLYFFTIAMMAKHQILWERISSYSFKHLCGKHGYSVSTSDCHAAGQEFESRLGNVHSTLYPFGVDKLSAKLVWDLNKDCLALG